MASKTNVILEGIYFGEAPRWHEGKLWFSDMGACRVMTVNPEGKTETVVEVPGIPSGLGWSPNGRLLIVSMSDQRLLRLEPEGLMEVADLSKLTKYHCNDMVVDRQGRAYIGHFGFSMDENEPFAPASVIMVTPDGMSQVVADNMAFPNGTVITPDGQKMIVAETYASRLTAFYIEPNGSLTGRHIWAELGDIDPDGICLDSEGAIWVASPHHKKVLRIREGGEVTECIKMSKPAFACMLGGPDRLTLFIMTAAIGPPKEVMSRPEARIEMIKVKVPGTGLP